MKRADKMIKNLVSCVSFYAELCSEICDANGIDFYDYADRAEDRWCGDRLERAMKYLKKLEDKESKDD